MQRSPFFTINRRLRVCLALLALTAACAAPLDATETETLDFTILYADAPPTIDGDPGDWDLSGGMFICGDVENLRDQFSVWFHAAWDKEYFYVLARWADATPLNNPGSVSGDNPWNGDSLQFRVIAAKGAPQLGVDDSESPTQQTTHISAWQDRDGLDAIMMQFGQKFTTILNDAQTEGAKQEFTVDEDGKGYVQEIAIPWSIIAPDGWSPEVGDSIVLTVEPNFGTESKFRITLKDLFRRGVVPNRVFTFMSPTTWGEATLVDSTTVEPGDLRLADNRKLPVRMEEGKPVVDWSPLFAGKERPGVVPIRFTMPEDGYVSLNIKDEDGKVVRQLLTANFYSKGEHEVLWDGMTNFSHMEPGEILPEGTYTWEAIHHNGLGLRLVGWADNGGKAPFDSPGGNWGGDFGNPVSVDTDGKQMYLGWKASEAGKAVVCTDLNGQVKWRQKRGGFGGANYLTVLDGVVYINDRQKSDNVIYRLTANKGEFIPWEGKEAAELDLTSLFRPYAPDGEEKPSLTGMDAGNGKLYLSYAAGNVVVVLDAKTGEELETIEVDRPTDLEVGIAGKLFVISDRERIVRFAGEGSEPEVVVAGLDDATAITLDPSGRIYVGVAAPGNQVLVFDEEGQAVQTIGQEGGRPLFGPWEEDGMLDIRGLQVDAEGKLWVMEDDRYPRRISLWSAETGEFLSEFFGPTTYGAVGGAISPQDPYTMVGQGSEWKIDPETGRAECVGVFHREGMYNSRFGVGPDDRLYVAVGNGWHGHHTVNIYERIAPGEWVIRTRIYPLAENEEDYKNEEKTSVKEHKIAGMKVWADANDDQIEQPNEVQSYPMDLNGWIDGWYMSMTQTMIFYGGRYRFDPVGWTACGAPVYDPEKSKVMPVPDEPKWFYRGRGMGIGLGHGTEDGKYMLYNGYYKINNDFQCFDIETGELKWTYPNLFVGVHGGHRAPPKETGMIRASYAVVGSVKLPEPIGNIFVIPTDKGEWHILTEDGYYLSSLFEADVLKIQWPDPAVPGAVADNIPPGMGAEDFGGSIASTPEGDLHVQAGKTAFINFKVVGLDTVETLPGGEVRLDREAIAEAAVLRAKLSQQALGTQLAKANRGSVEFSGNVAKDFEDLISWKSGNNEARAGIAYDDEALYVGWEVQDSTPWRNGAEEAPVLYARGDTVDLQLSPDLNHDPDRNDAAAGDLRLSIGNLQGEPTAVIYVPVSTEDDAPSRTFYSGVVRDGWVVDRVEVLDNVEIKVSSDPDNNRYTVEARIPFSALEGFAPEVGKSYRADFGVTYGNPANDDTVLRMHWNNQETGIVADEVFELKLKPSNWGYLKIEQ